MQPLFMLLQRLYCLHLSLEINLVRNDLNLQCCSKHPIDDTFLHLTGYLKTPRTGHQEYLRGPDGSSPAGANKTCKQRSSV